ncbi:hypothetical protein PDIDSM_4606 [Penicillium digitatum]|nr:hypothetical protein PDIDSM_4606 [Penicillium digitatum]
MPKQPLKSKNRRSNKNNNNDDDDMDDYLYVVLKDTTSWDSWLPYIKSIATQYDVWELCDPSQKVAPPPLAPPTKVISIEKAKEQYKDDWYQAKMLLHEEWIAENAIYTRKKNGVGMVVRAIRGTVHPTYQPLIIEYETPWELLYNLHKRFAPESDPTYPARLRRQWRSLDRGVDQSTDIDKWLINWETMQTRCKRAKLPEADNASHHFLDAISALSPEFYGTWVLKLQDRSDIEFTELLGRYRAHWRITHGKSTGQRENSE